MQIKDTSNRNRALTLADGEVLSTSFLAQSFAARGYPLSVARELADQVMDAIEERLAEQRTAA